MTNAEIIKAFLALPELDKHYVLGYIVAGDAKVWERAFDALDKQRNLWTV